ncbi:MAG: FUSC family protein [Verrucomicrobia bacterium]|nr:FUSC family protein [Verrucomicrobiota bacterium]
MSTTVKTDILSAERKWRWPLQDVFGDLRVRYGIKIGLAGMLALFGAQVIRLPHDNWAILTVLVMMNAQYIGSTAVKVVMRVLGTLGGAVVGVWLVGNYTNTPMIFLPVLFLVLAISGYKFGPFGPRLVPYAYFLVGLTTLSVVTNGIATPDQVWQVGIDRTEEILLGTMVALLVSTVVWPRSAREEFVTASRVSLEMVGRLVSLQTEAYALGTDPSAEVEKIRDAFPARLSILRNLVQAGSRESTLFAARLSNYNGFLVSLISLFQGSFALSQWRHVDAAIVERLQTELRSLSGAISEELSILSAPRRPGEKLLPSSLPDAFAAVVQKVEELRDQGFFATQSLQNAIGFGTHFAALRSLRDELINIRNMTEGLPRFGEPLPEAKTHWDLLPTIDWFWVKVGIKSGLVGVVAITLLLWIHPPGPGVLPLMAWIQTVLTRPFIRAGGTGDKGIFQNSFFASLALTGCIIVLLLITPFLANYLVMNLTLFAILFGLGFLSARFQGPNLWILTAWLAITVFVGLNPQQPVDSQTIIDSFIGLMTGMFIGALISRLIWPVLPQRLLKDNLLAVFSGLNALLRDDPHPERVKAQLALGSVEAQQVLRGIRMRGCTEQEKNSIAALIRALQAMVLRVGHLVSYRKNLPEAAEPLLRPKLERLEAEFSQMLNAFSECFRQGDCWREFPTLQGAVIAMDETVQEIRQSGILNVHKVTEPLRMLDIVGRYHFVAGDLEECSQLIRGLRIDRFWGDYAL